MEPEIDIETILFQNGIRPSRSRNSYFFAGHDKRLRGISWFFTIPHFGDRFMVATKSRSSQIFVSVGPDSPVFHASAVGRPCFVGKLGKLMVDLSPIRPVENQRVSEWATSCSPSSRSHFSKMSCLAEAILARFDASGEGYCPMTARKTRQEGNLMHSNSQLIELPDTRFLA